MSTESRSWGSVSRDLSRAEGWQMGRSEEAQGQGTVQDMKPGLASSNGARPLPPHLRPVASRRRVPAALAPRGSVRRTVMQPTGSRTRADRPAVKDSSWAAKLCASKPAQAEADGCRWELRKQGQPLFVLASALPPSHAAAACPRTPVTTMSSSTSSVPQASGTGLSVVVLGVEGVLTGTGMTVKLPAGERLGGGGALRQRL